MLTLVCSKAVLKEQEPDAGVPLCSVLHQAAAPPRQLRSVGWSEAKVQFAWGVTWAARSDRVCTLLSPQAEGWRRTASRSCLSRCWPGGGFLDVLCTRQMCWESETEIKKYPYWCMLYTGNFDLNKCFSFRTHRRDKLCIIKIQSRGFKIGVKILF